MSSKKKSKHKIPFLQKKAEEGFRGYPIATVAFYGPDNRTASKVVVGIFLNEDEEAAFMEKWFSEGIDVRSDSSINDQIIKFVEGHNVKSVSISDGIIGCPHEEGIDYPEGQSCPECPFWANRDRWTGELIQ